MFFQIIQFKTCFSYCFNVTAANILYCTILQCIVLYCIVLYCIVLYYIALYYIVLYCIVLYYIALYCIVLYCIILHCIALYCIELHYFLYLSECFVFISGRLLIEDKLFSLKLSNSKPMEARKMYKIKLLN